MKYPIVWHKQRLTTLIASCKRLRQAAWRAENDFKRCEKDTLFLQEQINPAEKQNKDSFDPDKFNKKRT